MSGKGVVVGDAQQAVNDAAVATNTLGDFTNRLPALP